MNLVWAEWIFSQEVHHVGGSCCGGCDLTKAAFPPTNPSLAVWTIAQPPQITLLLSPLSLMCVPCTHTLSLTLTCTHFMLRHSRNFPLAGEHCSQLRCQLQYMVESQRLFAGTLFLPTWFSWLFPHVHSYTEHMVYCTSSMHFSQQQNSSFSSLFVL